MEQGLPGNKPSVFAELLGSEPLDILWRFVLSIGLLILAFIISG